MIPISFKLFIQKLLLKTWPLRGCEQRDELNKPSPTLPEFTFSKSLYCPITVTKTKDIYGVNYVVIYAAKKKFSR